MRSPLGIAFLFTLALVAWFLSRPVQEMLSAAPEPFVATSEPRPIATATPGSDAPRMTVRAVDSIAVPIAPELVINGHTAPARSIVIRAETSGRVVETPVAEGALVEAGTVLIRLDLRDRASRVQQMEAWLTKRALDYDAARKLGEKQFQAETRIAEMRAELEETRADLHEARLDLERIEIKAPFAGVLEAREVEVGDFVAVGGEVARVIEQDPYLVVGDAPETMVRHFRIGQPGTAQLADGRIVQGHIRYVATLAEPSTRTFRVELEVPNPDTRFPAGMSARIAVQEPSVAAHRISAATLVLADDGQVGIKAVGEDDVVRFHPARIIKAETDALWLGGLPERLRLVTTGQGFVAAGEKVRVELVQPESVELPASESARS